MFFYFILQTFLRHPDCQAARLARAGIFSSIRSALDTVSKVVEESPQPQSPTNTSLTNGIATTPKRAHTVLKEFLVRSLSRGYYGNFIELLVN